MSIFSSQALFDEKVIDQVGHFLTPMVDEFITICGHSLVNLLYLYTHTGIMYVRLASRLLNVLIDEC